MIPINFCQYGNHYMPPNSGYSYIDSSHGITKDIHICEACYKKHILQYFPDSPMAAKFRAEDSERQHSLFEETK